MAIPLECPENGLPCAGREWLNEVQQNQEMNRLDVDVHAFVDGRVANSLFRAWDVLGGHARARKANIDSGLKSIEYAAQRHEKTFAALDEPICRQELCGTMAQFIADKLITE